MENKQKQLPDILPVLPVRDSVIFPRMIVPLMITDEKYSKLVDEVLQKDKLLVIAMVVDADESSEEETPELNSVGTVVQVVKLSKSEEGMVLVVQGTSRVALNEIISDQPYRQVQIEELQEELNNSQEVSALISNILSLFNQIVDLSPHLPQELAQMAQNAEQPGALADMVVSTLNLDRYKKQDILESLDINDRLNKVTLLLNEELELQKMGKRIQDQVKKGIDKTQREYYLREQLKAIRKELGMDQEEEASEIREIKEKIQAKAMPDAARKVAEKEIQRLAKTNPMSPEYNVSRTYLEWILDLPWKENTQDNLELKKTEQILNKRHYNLEKIKKRILEYLAVRKLNPGHKGPILCLVGPPGTGKTSLGRSIATALGRSFVRISLGGVRDEAEIRGHRRTYVGALPGRIIQGIKKGGYNNPVFMLDEVDKIGMDFRGDPSSALLEVLDPEQNFSFSDHYLELEFDLSQVMFICTANQLDTVPPPLRDRMEVLELAGYTEDEKANIATKFLLPRQTAEHGLDRRQAVFRKKAIRKIIRQYTREAGVRNLEREIGAICRGLARKVAEGGGKKFVITDNEIREYLGNPKFTQDLAQRTSVPGVATGLAWTPVGGDILFVEATMMAGNKSLVLTGQLGDVMKESAQAALSYLRSKNSHLGIDDGFFADKDLHIHVPAGAIPKDGPSAGVTMLTALASMLTSRPVKSKTAMTGEVTLRGSVLPVGGIKEKLLAASRGGLKEVILPAGNKADLDEIPQNIKGKMRFHLVNKMDEVLDIALKPAKKGKPPAG